MNKIYTFLLLSLFGAHFALAMENQVLEEQNDQVPVIHSEAELPAAAEQQSADQSAPILEFDEEQSRSSASDWLRNIFIRAKQRKSAQNLQKKTSKRKVNESETSALVVKSAEEQPTHTVLAIQSKNNQIEVMSSFFQRMLRAKKEMEEKIQNLEERLTETERRAIEAETAQLNIGEVLERVEREAAYLKEEVEARTRADLEAQQKVEAEAARIKATEEKRREKSYEEFQEAVMRQWYFSLMNT